MTAEKTYEDGVIEGRLSALETCTAEHKERLDWHARRLRLMERALWVFLGVLLLAQALPTVQKFLSSIGN